MDETVVRAVVEALFEKLKASQVNHPVVVKLVDLVETLALKEVPNLMELVKSKLS